MRMLLVDGLLLIAVQTALVYGQSSVHPDLSRTPQQDVTETVININANSLKDSVQYAVTESAREYNAGRASEGFTNAKNDIKSQTQKTTDSVFIEGSTGNVFPSFTADTEQTVSVGREHIITDKTNPPAQTPVRFPGDQTDKYSNSIYLQGHVFGIRDDIMDMIHMALSSGNTFVPVEPLRVYPLQSSFEEMGFEGEKYTNIRYVVSYNGNPIHTEVITRLMSSPKVSHHFKNQLEGRQLREYKAAKSVKNETWIHKHLVAVVVPSCVAFIIILAVVFAVVRKRRVTRSKMEEKKRTCKFNVVSDKKCSPPPPYSVVNPAYNFETSAVMEGYNEP